ncbi:MAG TPA: phosphotransferase [Candidatus Saccharibacteria bacterium]|nr:phosphotransferase [Candidatus Saccharibacteria bacterium]HRK93878.1 phosphotransferase [Candidatus Saccharibacteria bacterium]
MVLEHDKLPVIETLQESKRFLVQAVAHQGMRTVIKKAKMPPMRVNLEHELQAYRLYEQLTQDPDCPFNIASVLEFGDDWVLLSYLEGQPMSEIVTDETKQVMYDRLADIMAFCDNRIGITIDGERMPQNAQQISIREAHVSITLALLDTLENFDAGFLMERLETVAEKFLENHNELETAFVNPDLTPPHVMINGADVAIFDFENARIDGARFADLINFATKIVFVEGDVNRAKNFFDRFWQSKGESCEPYLQQLKTLMYQRCLGFTTELITEPNEIHNTSLEMNAEYARNIDAVIRWADSL